MSNPDDLRQLTLARVIGRLFPGQTQIFHSDKPVRGNWPAPPDFPPDLFAATAYLLELAGAYQYSAFPDDRTGLWGSAIFDIDAAKHKECVDAGRTWSQEIRIPPLVKRIWSELGRHADESIYSDHRVHMKPIRWWSLAIRLLIIADEASADVGFGYTEELGSHAELPTWVQDLVQAVPEEVIRRLVKRTKNGHITYYPQAASICINIDPDVTCVQPKSRTPAIGCTLRTFSHNLALLPPRGVVKARWQKPPHHLTHDDQSALNLLLVPFPYGISAGSFMAEPGATIPNGTSWGWFGIDQFWLNGSQRSSKALRTRERQNRQKLFLKYVSELIARAKQDVTRLNGIIFPEYALDWDYYNALVLMIKRKYSEIEFLIAGSSSNCRDETGNIALSTVFSLSKNGKRRLAITTSRSKHHRWRLNEAQISTYALASSLDPRMLWWERTLLPKRELHIDVFRTGSTFATMICEDLARVDPAHTVLRSVAPSLVFVLLMDGPQLPERWSSRYATVLAEDPGSSVLTLTSTALLERSNRSGDSHRASRSVALWKEDTGKTVTISLPSAYQAVVLTLSGYRTKEITLDGRLNGDGRAWRYNGHQPIALSPSRFQPKELEKLMAAN